MIISKCYYSAKSGDFAERWNFAVPGLRCACDGDKESLINHNSPGNAKYNNTQKYPVKQKIGYKNRAEYINRNNSQQNKVNPQ